MGKYMKKCKAIGEIAVTEVDHHQQQVGVRTRARTLAMAADSTTTSTAGKKRKISTSGELHFSSSFIQLRRRRKLLITSENSISPTNSDNSARLNPSNLCSSPSSDDFPASRCSSNGSSMLVNESLISSSTVDLEGEGFQIENSNSLYLDCRERREKTPSSNLQAGSGELEPTERIPVANSSRHRSSTKEKIMPSEADIEEFFSVAEKDEQKRFADRYNFDFVKELPLEGRYEWVRLTQ